MSAPKFGVPPTEWAKHLRPYGRKRFWRKVRQKIKKQIREEGQ